MSPLDQKCLFHFLYVKEVLNSIVILYIVVFLAFFAKKEYNI